MPPVNDEESVEVAGHEEVEEVKEEEGPRKFVFPSHQLHMVNLAKMCQENKEFTDCVIRCGDDQGNQLRAHRLVLGAVSPFLKLVFGEVPPSLAEATILVPGVRQRVVKALLDFLYTGQMTVDRRDTSDLQLLIETLQIDPELITVDVVPKDKSKDEEEQEVLEVVQSASTSKEATNEESTNNEENSSKKRKVEEEEEEKTNSKEDQDENEAKRLKKDEDKSVS